jgi:signal transduction histidine kinase
MTAQEFASLLRPLPEPHLVLTAEGEIVAANAPALRLLGLESGMPPVPALVALVTDQAARVREQLERWSRSGSMVPGRLTPRNTGKPCRCRGSAVNLDAGAHGRFLLVRFEPDEARSSRFTALNRTIEDLTRETHERMRAEEALRAGQRRAAFLAEASRVLATSLDYEETLRNLARLAVPELADWCAVDLTAPDGSLVRVAVEHPDPARVQLAHELHSRYPTDPDAPYGAAQAVRTGESQFVPVIPDGLLESAAANAEHLAMIRSLALHSFIVVPVSTSHARLGALSLVYAESGRVYTEADLAVLEDLGRRAGTAIENARLVQAMAEARDRIEEQAGELELQTEQLQVQATQLEEQAYELQQQLNEVEELNAELARSNAGLHAARQQAEAAREEAERANQAKSQFLAVMSHELRTPMNAIMGFTDLLDAEISGPLNDVQKQQLGRVRGGARHLLGLIDQVLSLARIEAGREDVLLSNADVPGIVRDVTSMMEPLATRRGLELRVVLPTRPPRFLTDEGKVRQILLNLVGNAIKFTAEGRVELEVESRNGTMLFHIRDTGQGIAPDDIERVFNPFEQVDQSITRKAEGTGLGLSVSRQLARLLGGDVLARSEPGQGSTFTLTLPAKAEPDRDA